MIIKKMILENIGPYVNTNTFDLSVTNKKNIILIGGKNGSGKTTFLKALKYGLFGSFALGYKNDTKKYYEEIFNLVNTEKNRTKFSIKIVFNLIEDEGECEYSIKRSWFLINNTIDEKIEVFQKEKELDDYEALEFFEKIKSFTSPQLINSMIFDGEKIGNIIQNDEINQFLEETFCALFNINMLNQLKIDLNTYLEKRTNENVSQKEIQAYSLMTEINFVKNNIKALENEIASIKSKLSELNYKKKDLIKEFNNLGGLSKNQVSKLIEELGNLTKELEQKNKYFKAYLENDVCFLLNLKLLKSAFSQIQDELPLYYLNQLKVIEDFLNIEQSSLRNLLIEKIKPDTEILHNVGDVDSEYLENLYEKYNKKYRFIRTYLMNKENESLIISKYKKQIISNEQIEKFDILLIEIEKVEETLTLLNNEFVVKTNKLKDLKEKFNKLHDNLIYINNEIRKSQTHDKSFNMAVKAIEINDYFISYLKEKKLKEISARCTEIFNETIRKEKYIKKISIETDYSISLFDINGNLMKLKTLSAGEIQLLISSIIWAMFKVSGRNETFVFDTPLARLDVENRLTFINKIVKTISNQVIILSTDSEIVNQNYDVVEENASKIYRLDYINDKKITKIVKGYFGENI